MIARMNVRNEGFHSIRDIFHRAAKHDAEPDHRHVFMIHVQLHAERPADIRRDHAYAGFRNAVVTRVKILKLIRRLRGMVHGQLRFAGIVVGDDRPRLHRNGGMPAEVEFFLHHVRSTSKELLDATGVDLPLKAEIAAELRRDHWPVRIACRVDIDHNRKFVELNRDQFNSIFRQCTRVRDNSYHRLPRPYDLVDGKRQLRRRLHALEMIHGADPWRADLCEILTGGHKPNTWHFPRRLSVDRHDPGMRIGTANIGNMHHARQHNVSDITPAPSQKSLCIRARDRAADIGIRTIQRGDRTHAPTSSNPDTALFS